MNHLDTFGDVMRAFPYERLWELLNAPRDIDETTFQYLVSWCRPKVFTGGSFSDAVVCSGLLASKSEVYRKVKERALRWNGRVVLDPNMPVQFFEPGWGVARLGRTNHAVLVDQQWCFPLRPT